MVIISDAMRYEVGAELAALLAEDPKSTVQLTAPAGRAAVLHAVGHGGVADPIRGWR